MNKLKIAGIAKDSIVDGPGLRYTVFTQGCFHKCEGCHNPQTHDPNGGYFIDIEDIYNEFINNDTYKGITFSGGEPFLQADSLADLAIKINKAKKNVDIIVYTGYTYEEIDKIIKEGSMSYFRLLNNIDYLIDGRFIKDKASLDCEFRGSTNQRIIDVKETLRLKKIIEKEF